MKEKMPLVCSDDYGKDEAGAQVCSLLLMISFKKIFFKQLSSHWDFSHGKFGLLSLGKGSCDRVAPPNLPCILVVFFHIPPNSDINYRIFNVCTDVNACNCTRGCRDTVRESALRVNSWRKIPCCTRDSNLPPWCCKGLFSKSQLSVQTLLQCPYTPVCSHLHYCLG